MGDAVLFATWVKHDPLIHVIHSDARNYDALRRSLRVAGFETSFSVDAQFILEKMKQLPIQAILVDETAAGGRGIEVLRQVVSNSDRAPVIFMCAHDNAALAVEALRCGATDVITKPFDSDRWLDQIDKLVKQATYLGVAENGRRPIELGGLSQLTPREREVLQRVVNGQSNKKTGEELGISPRTVATHRAKIMLKLGAHNTADLMRIILT